MEIKKEFELKFYRLKERFNDLYKREVNERRKIFQLKNRIKQLEEENNIYKKFIDGYFEEDEKPFLFKNI